MQSTTAGLGPSLVRTLVPIIIGPLVARYGFDPQDPEVLIVVSGVVSYLYYVIVRVLETKAPSVGYLLGIAKAPAYSPRPQPQSEPPVGPGPGEDEKPAGVPAYEFPSGDTLDSTAVFDSGAPVAVTDRQE